MLGFMTKTVLFVFIQVLLMALGSPSPVRAEAAFQATAATGSKASDHLDFSIMIQPSLFLRMGVKAARAVVSQNAAEAQTLPTPTTALYGTEPANEEAAPRISAARITIYGNNGSVNVSSATTRLAPDKTNPLADTGERLHQTAITLPARRKIVNVEQNWQHDDAGALSMLSKADGGKLASRAANRVVYTAAQL
jgi:hypothetical protein